MFEIAPPIVPTELAGMRQGPDDAEHTMTAAAVAAGIIDALANDRYEVPLGPAANLFKMRDALFAAINE